MEDVTILSGCQADQAFEEFREMALVDEAGPHGGVQRRKSVFQQLFRMTDPDRLQVLVRCQPVFL